MLTLGISISAVHLSWVLITLTPAVPQVMLTLGISTSAVRLSWVLTALLLTLPSVLAVTLILCYGGVLRYSSVSLVFCLLLLFALDNIALA